MPEPGSWNCALPEDEPVDFYKEMAALGVDGVAEALPRAEERPPADNDQTVPDGAPESERDLFLREVGEMAVCFKDELPAQEPERPVTASARRRKQLRRGTLKPEATLDLHGETRHTLEQKLQFFLEDATYQGLKTVLVVTGRGNHSAEGPVLRDGTERYLQNSAKRWVVEWCRAPRHYGGQGALVVFLR